MKLASLITLFVCLGAHAAQYRTTREVDELNRKGLQLYAESRFPEAEATYRRALTLQQAIAEGGEDTYAVILNNLGSSIQAQGRMDEAMQFFEQALSIQEKILGPADARVGHALNNIALLWRRRDEPLKAVLLLQSALKLQIKDYGPTNPEVGITLHNLGSVYYDLGQKRKAASLFRESLAIQEKSSPGPSLAATLGFLGRLAADSRKYEEALSLYERALHLRQMAPGNTRARSCNYVGRSRRALHGSEGLCARRVIPATSDRSIRARQERRRLIFGYGAVPIG